MKTENVDTIIIENTLIEKWDEVLEKRQIIFLPFIMSKNPNYSEKLWDMVIRDIKPFIKSFGETVMVNNIWAYYQIKLDDKDIWKEVERHLLFRNIKRYNSSNLCKILFCLSNIHKEGLYDFSKVYKKILDKFKIQWMNGIKTWDGRDLAFVFYALVIFEVDFHNLVIYLD